MSAVTFLAGDCVESMRSLPDKSVHCCVTSPPYFGLRDYGMDGQIGLEETPAAYVAKLVAVFTEVWRVLRDDGSLWLNLGDSYSAKAGQRKPTDKAGYKQHTNIASTGTPSRCVDGLGAKNLIGIPWRVAFALQDAGWYLRQDIIWAKTNPMPESVKDRCTRSHEYIFHLTKSSRYFYDADAIQEDAVEKPRKCGKNSRANVDHVPREVLKQDAIQKRTYTGFNERYDFENPNPKRNKRDVWTVSVIPFKGAHFATFPPKLIEPCILAGCPVGGIVLDPFGGAGTTGLVAQQHGRSAILCELNPEYVTLARTRIEAATPAPRPAYDFDA